MNSNDVAGEHPEIVERLAEQLDSWHRWALRWALQNRLPTDDTVTEGMTSEELERLRSLGYVQ